MKTCSTCKHWIKRPLDPRNLSADQGGECRGGPPSVIALPTPRGVTMLSQYPVLPTDFPACARHEERLQILDDAG